MSAIRTNNIYISSQLHRWLKWLAEMDPDGKETSDGIAEALLRELLLTRFPDIEQLESEYWTARNKLDKEITNKLKQQQTNATKPTGTDSGANKPEIPG